MSALEITRNETYGNMFLPRIYGTITDRQYRGLQQLHITAVVRGDAIHASPHGVAGGWNLTAPPATFEKLLGIAQAILTDNLGALNTYRLTPPQ